MALCKVGGPGGSRKGGLAGEILCVHANSSLVLGPQKIVCGAPVDDRT